MVTPERGPDWYKIEQEMAARQKVDDEKQAAFDARVYADFGMKVGSGVRIPTKAATDSNLIAATIPI